MTAANELERLSASLADRYHLERQLGVGGMATVYLAHDIRHDRKVALKVIREELAAVVGTDRFLNEIKVTANLHHPHILGLIDSGSLSNSGLGSRPYYVMPYVEGESLRGRLSRERQLPVLEALAITKAVAGALDFAHRRGVVHRDIKPENILLQDGQPVVADFGIALALSTAGGTRLTGSGISLGTPQYMSPEQATGDRSVDARSDIYSLACVLYEMLAAEPPHTGGTAQVIVGKIIADTPRPVSELRGTVPPHISGAISVALAKLPADRFATAADFASALDGRGIHGILLESPPKATPRRGLPSLLPWGLVVALGLLSFWLVTRKPASFTEPTRFFNISLPDTAPLVFIGDATFGIGQPALALSPDGSKLVYVGEGSSARRLYLRSLTSPEPGRALPGTEGAFGPFFSPDGEWVAFFVQDQLKRVSISGGQVLQIAQVYDPFGGTWGKDDRIALISEDGTQLGIVPASGGRVEYLPISRSAHPTWLPGGQWVLHTCSRPRLHMCATSPSTRVTRDIRVIGSEDTDDGLVLGTRPLYLPSGHLAFSALASNVLMGVPFEHGEATAMATPVPLVRDVRRENAWGAQQLAVSENGVLVYASGENAEASTLVLADPDGTVDSLPLPQEVYGSFDLSPDGRHLAVTVLRPNGENELWLIDIERGRSRRWDGELSALGVPTWAPTSDWLVLTTSVTPGTLVRISNAAGAGADTLYHGKATLWADDVLPDGRILVRYEGNDRLHNFLTLLTPEELKALTAPSAPVPSRLIRAPGNQHFGVFSPDGQWLAFISTQSGRLEIYAVRSPFNGEPIQVSTQGGEIAQWSRDGDALFFRDGRRWYRVPVVSSPTDPFGQPEFYLEGEYLNVLGREFNIARDGRRLLLLRGTTQRTATTLTVVTNWSAEVERVLGRR